MKFLVASDKFKGSLTALEVCQNVEKGIKDVVPEAIVKLMPMADGGEGSLDVLIKTLDLAYVETLVRDPLFRKIKAGYGMKGDTAYIEMARSSGLELLPEHERDPLKSSSHGVGQLMRDALNHGAKRIYLFVGGSATNDGGIGMLSGLGFKLLAGGQQLEGRGEDLIRIDEILPPENLPAFELTIVTDVQNKLLGPMGATRHYGPQKGADSKSMELLEVGMERFSTLISKNAGFDVSEIPGSGAAGGIAVSGVGVLRGKIKKGIDTFLKVAEFQTHLNHADWVITGEGKMDSQTLQGKVVHGVAKVSMERRIPTIVICGVNEVDNTELELLNIRRVLSLKTTSNTVAQCINQAPELICQRISDYFRGILDAQA